KDRFELKYANGYRSMRKVVEPHMYMIDYLVSAIEKAGVKPNELPFRGGTDGSAISQRGLPCPNISAGYENGHSRFEFVPIQAMEKNVEILINLVENFVNKEEG
ncbi:MAG: peptidase T, partial [Lachnospiraceae bacterium]|nr:peptidase T [Lachnospiraceae bacterium]